MKDQKGRGRVEIYLYSSFNLGARWGKVVNATPPSLVSGEKAVYAPCKGWEVPRIGLDT